MAKDDPAEELVEMHLEVQQYEKEFKECVDIYGQVLRRNKELYELNKQKDEATASKMGKTTGGAQLDLEQ